MIEILAALGHTTGEKGAVLALAMFVPAIVGLIVGVKIGDRRRKRRRP